LAIDIIVDMETHMNESCMQAEATASINWGCNWVKPKAEIEASVKADITQLEGCYIREDGNGYADAGGGTYTEAVRYYYCACAYILLNCFK
jgi:hypothetical protein